MSVSPQLREKHRPGRSSSPWPRAWRTLSLGTLIGLVGGLLTLAGIALVDRTSLKGPILGSTVPPEAVLLARKALAPLEGGPRWEVVVRCDTPWGTTLRLRPFVEGIEVRGADCLLHLGDDKRPWTIETDPSDRNWPALRKDTLAWKEWAARLGDKAASSPAGAMTGSLEARFLNDISSALRARGAHEPAEKQGQVQVRLFVELRETAEPPWVFGSELAVGDTSSAAPDGSLPLGRALPWVGQVPERALPSAVKLVQDPRSFALIEARDLRFMHTASPPAQPPMAPSRVSTSSDGWGLLFDPNPVVTSGNRALRLGSSVDSYRLWVFMPRLDDSGYLRGPYVEVTTGQPPQAHEEGRVFSYRSADPHFTEAMAYLHGDRALWRVDSLGFHGLFSEPLRMRPHGTRMDNSWYSRPERTVVLGDGGVEDAQDADIILHETGHAIHDAFVPGFGEGQTVAISEGFSDFWAASLTGDPCIGDWDATAYSPPCLREADSPATYPASLTGQVHEDGAIWSGSLWDLRQKLGARTAEQLALAAFLEQGTSSTYPEAARGLLNAAERIGLGDRIPELRDVLTKRGLLPQEIDATLVEGDERRVDLLTPGRFLGRPVLALILCGDGKIFFTAERQEKPKLEFPSGPPAIFPCASAQPRPGLRLHLSGTLDGTGARILEEWQEDGSITARVELLWNQSDGSLEWTYLDLQGVQENEFSAGASRGQVGPDSTVMVQLGQLPSEGLGGLRSFVGRFQPEMIRGGPSRFRVVPEDSSGGFRLLQEEVPQGTGGLDARAQPNPFRLETSFRLYQRRQGNMRVEVYDLMGRRLRLLANGPLSTGVHFVTWDGRDQIGRAVPAGLYWARLQGSSGKSVIQLLRLR